MNTQDWQPISTAPKEEVWREPYTSCSSKFHIYGAWVLVSDGLSVIEAHWWASSDGEASNWITRGGNAFHPTHWMELPPPPTT